MKFRNGFVSNSSSSSFIVAFPRIPLNEESVREMMFDSDDRKEITLEYYDHVMTIEQIASRVFSDIQDSSIIPINEEAIYSAFEEDYAIDYFDDYQRATTDEERNKIREDADKQNEIESKKNAKKFLEDTKGQFVYEFEYHDDSNEALLEHGDIFRNLPHIQISNH